MKKSQYPHPMQNQTQDDFMNYAEYIMEMPEEEFNTNNCSEKRSLDMPYVTYEAIEESIEFKKGAQVKILKSQNNPDSFMVDADNISKHDSLWVDVSILTSEDSEWEDGNIPWNTILKRLHKGTLKEVQRDVKWGIFEYKGILQASIRLKNESPMGAHTKYLTQLIELIETGRKCNLSYKILRELAINSSQNEVDFSTSVQEHCKEKGLEFIAFGFTSTDTEINSLLSDVSMVLESSSNNEIKVMLAFVCRALGAVKKSQASSSRNAEEFKNRVQSSGHMEVMCAIIEESKVVEENLESFITKEKGEHDGTIPSA